MSTLSPDSHKPAVAPSGMDHDALPPGTRFGEFEILRVLGVGGFGIVYLANDHSLEREVALKEYMPASLAARGLGPQITVRSSSFAETYAIGLRSFVNEARLLARFDHPSLVKVYRFWEDNATAYMVMPFLQGTTLRDTRRAMPHPPDEAWIRSVMAPILSALELLHREGVYHRDIAPDNILLPPDGPPVLLDFGAARRVISDRTQSLTAILKPSYAPIEQYAEMTQLRQGPWTDLYALGAVVHYLLFGVPPAPATARAVQDEADTIETRIVPGVSPAFLEAIAWMLSIRPAHRPQSGEQLRAVLDGHAAIPARGRPGITLPGAVAPAAVAAVFEPTRHVDRPSRPGQLDTAQAPTYLPTAQVPRGSVQRPGTFSPTAQMPTAREAAPAERAAAPAADPATTAPSMRRTAVPGGGWTTPPGAPAAPAPASTVPPAARAPAAARPATVPPPVTALRPPAPSLPPRTQPAPLAAKAAPPAAVKAGSSKTGLVVAGGVALAAIVAVAGWQALAGRSATPAAGAEQAAASAAASVPSVSVAVPGVVAPPAVVAGTVPAPAVPTAVTSSTVVVVPATAVPAAVLPPPSATSVATTAPALGAAPARPPASGLPVPTLAAGSRAGTPASGAEARLAAADRAASAAAVALAASNARARLAGRAVPRTDGDPGSPSSGNPAGRAADAGNAANPIGTSRPVPAVAEAVPTSAHEACGKRVFIALAVCMDEKCEEPRYRGTAECIGILARKTARENR